MSSPYSILYATSLTASPASSPHPPASLALHPITPSDTIRDLLARDNTSMCESTPLFSSQDNSQIVQQVNLQKRKCHVSESALGEPSNKRAAKATGRRKRVSIGTKKERKREQNKTAALRYRQKKKGEKVDFDQQQRELEEKNLALRSTLSSMEAEISYLTRLWSEVEHAKRLRQ